MVPPNMLDKPENSTKDGPPSKMQKANSSGCGLNTWSVNEQRFKQQSCISFQREATRTVSNIQPNMGGMLNMLQKILISVEANRKTENVQWDPVLKKI